MNIFGFQIKKKKEDVVESLVTAVDDGAVVLSSSMAAAYYSSGVDFDTTVKNENDLIRRYREISHHPECDTAIDEIVNEAICADDKGSVAEINLESLKFSDAIKRKIRDEFEEVKHLLDFDVRAYDRFRNWYIDGRQYFLVSLDADKPKLGIRKIDFIDPRKIRKVKDVKKKKDTATGLDIIVSVKEYFVYNENGIDSASTSAAQLSVDSVVYCPSGLYDPNTNMMYSYLHKAIKPINQLKMLEDATVIYRLARAPERRVFYIDVGNLPKMKAEQYVTDIMNKFKNKIVYDASTGEVTDRTKHTCLVLDTKIPLLDGRTLELNEIIEEINNDKKLWAYSCDPVTGKFSPGLITWAGVTRKNTDVMKITLDNGKSIVCTPDHKFPVWNKGFVRADELEVNESMIPHYTRQKTLGTKFATYEQIFKNDVKEWNFTHREVSKWKDENNIENEYLFNDLYENLAKSTVHHKDINSKNNSPDNLVKMHSKDHFKMHGVIGTSGGKIGGARAKELGLGYFNKSHPEYYTWKSNAGKIGGAESSKNGACACNFEKGRQKFAELIKDPNFNQWFREQQKIGWSDEKRSNHSNLAKTNRLSEKGREARKLRELSFKDENSEASKEHRRLYKTEYTKNIIDAVKLCVVNKLSTAKAIEFLNSKEELLEEFKDVNNEKVTNKQKEFNRFCYNDLSRITHEIGGSFNDLKNRQAYQNHKVVSIEFLSEKMDTGCITVDGDGKYHNNHTFALDAGIYTKNSMLEDFYLPRREGGKSTEIQTLPSGQNLGTIEDIEYFQKKVYQSLNVPISRMIPQQGFSLGRSTEVTRDEVKFHKFISRLQNQYSQVLIDLLRIQLIAKNIIPADDWADVEKNICIDFIKDNNFVELKSSELLMNRFATLTQIEGMVGKWVSEQWVKENILKFNEEEIIEMDRQIADEKPKENEVDDEPIEDEDETDADAS